MNSLFFNNRFVSSCFTPTLQRIFSSVATVISLAPLILGCLPAAAQGGTLLENALDEARPPSSLRFAPATDFHLSGKGRGTPENDADGLGIALIFSQNNYWQSDRWSAAGYGVNVGTLSDSEGRIDPVIAYRISAPTFAEDFSFVASGNDLFLRFPEVDDYTVYSIIPLPDIDSVDEEKPIRRFLDHYVIEEALVSATDIVAGEFTKIASMNLHRLTTERVFFYLPRSTNLEATTRVSEGVSLARLSKNTIAQSSSVIIDVSAIGEPENTHTGGKRPGGSYGARAGLIGFSNADGGVSVFWQNQANGYFAVTTLRSDLTHSTVGMPRTQPILGDCTRDPEGNYYYITHADGDYPLMFLVKASHQGVELAWNLLDITAPQLNVKTMSGTANGVRLHYSQGILCAVFARVMNNGHQGSIIVTYRPDNLQQIKHYGQNSSHSFDSRIVHDGENFVTLSLGDNYPRGVVMHKVRPEGKKGRVIYTYKTKHRADGLSSNDNRTYTDLGDIVPGEFGFGVLMSSEAGTNNHLATSDINESRNLGYLLVARNYDQFDQTDYIVSPWMILSPGAYSPVFGFYDFGGNFRYQQYLGVRWLTFYTDKENEHAHRPKMIGLEDGKRLVLWEKWTPDRHVSTHGMVIDIYGNPWSEVADLRGMRLSDGDRVIRSGSRVHSFTANGRELEWTTLDLDRALPREVEVLDHSFDRAGNQMNLIFRTTPGRTYWAESSTKMAPGDWTVVPGSSVLAFGPTNTITCPVVAGEALRLWRVVEAP